MTEDRRQGERRTLVRRQLDRASAGVLRGEVSPYMGEVVESPDATPQQERDGQTRYLHQTGHSGPIESCADDDCFELSRREARL